MDPSRSSTFRSRTNILLSVGAAAFITYLIFNRFSAKPVSEGLHRSHSVRRPNRRRRAEQLQTSPAAETTQAPSEDRPPTQPFNQQGTYELVYHMAGELARDEGTVHRKITCDQCGQSPIRGVRYKCVNCADYELCSICEMDQRPTDPHHSESHILYKIRLPCGYAEFAVQDPFYRGRLLPQTLSPESLRKSLQVTTLSEARIRALWDQYQFMATSHDLLHVTPRLTRDDLRQALRTCVPLQVPAFGTLVIERLVQLFCPNTAAGSEDDEITFLFFVVSTWRLVYANKKERWEALFRGYDLDGDWVVHRKDVVLLLQSHFSLEREAARRRFALSDEQRKIPRSSRPLSSAVQMDHDVVLRFSGPDAVPAGSDDENRSALRDTQSQDDFEGQLSSIVNKAIEDLVDDLVAERGIVLKEFVHLMCNNPAAEVLGCWLDHIYW